MDRATELCNGTQQGMSLVTVINKSKEGQGLALEGLLTVWVGYFCISRCSRSQLLQWEVGPAPLVPRQASAHCQHQKPVAHSSATF